MGVSAPDLRVAFDVLPAGAPVAAGDPLFPRQEALPDAEAPAVPEPTSAKPSKKEKTPVSDAPAPAPAAEGAAFIEYDDFAKVQLKVGKVLAAERVPKADKLLKLSVDCGEDAPRTILAGIAKVHAPENLVGQRVVVVANLKPRVMRGIESQGMILAAGGEDIVALVTTATDVAAGAGVK
jgi:methionyl-tRNA synthetase